MPHFISPNFTHEKLESPSYVDLVDVFEDRMRNWFFLPARTLLNTPHCDIAAVALLLNYFEGIEIYITGEDSKYKSQIFFAKGFEKVFTVEGQDQELTRKIIDAIYAQARCGFAHDGMFRNRVIFNRISQDPIFVTWPKRDAEFDRSGKIESIVISPPRFYESIETHFNRYIKALREASDKQLTRAFETTTTLKWGLDDPDPWIWMTEDEFLGNKT